MKKIFSIALMGSILQVNAQKAKPNTKIETPKKPVAKSTTVIKTQKDSVGYAMGVNIANSLKSQKLESLDSKIMVMAIEDNFKGKKLLIKEVDCMQTAQNFVANQSKEVKSKITPKKAGVLLSTSKDSASYAIGVNIATSLKMQNMNDLEPKLIGAGLNDALTGKTLLINDNDATTCVSKYIGGAEEKKAAKAKADGKKFLDANAKKAGVKVMPEGWQYEVIKESTSVEKPKATDKVKVHYHGTLIDGTVFDSSVDRGEPISFGLNQVIKGWTLAVTQMNVGSKWRIFLPSDLAYGNRGAGGKIGPGATLIFEVELLEIEK